MITPDLPISTFGYGHIRFSVDTACIFNIASVPNGPLPKVNILADKSRSGFDPSSILIQIFQANTDPWTAVTHPFLEPVYAQIVRITCLCRKDDDSTWNLRFELLSCRNDT